MSSKNDPNSANGFRIPVVPEEEAFDPIDLVYDESLYFEIDRSGTFEEDTPFGTERFYIEPRHLDGLISSFKKATTLYENATEDSSIEGDWLEPISPVGDEVTYALSGVGDYGFQIDRYDHEEWAHSITINWYFPDEITAALKAAKQKLA
ncbi:hypothetical protein [Salarchaeum japonicum]|uniref:hypothetical protein n=1 Tax=Salarchaeum japonicum TaxID=555573 RepID=UPI003C768A88